MGGRALVTRNAILLSVKSSADSTRPIDPYDDQTVPEDGQVTRWSGIADAHVKSGTNREFNGQSVDIWKDVTITIPADLVEVEIEDELEVRFNRRSESFTVEAFDEIREGVDSFPALRCVVTRR